MDILLGFLADNSISLMLIIALAGLLWVQRADAPQVARHFFIMLAFLLAIKFFALLAMLEDGLGPQKVTVFSYLSTYAQYLLYSGLIIEGYHIISVKKPPFVFYVPYLALVLICLANMVDHHVLFWFDENRSWHSSSLHFVPYVVAVFYLAVTFIHTAVYYRKRHRGKSLILVVIMLLTLYSLFIESHYHSRNAIDIVGTVASIDLLLYAYYFSVIYQNEIKNHYYQTQLELSDSRIRLMQSQIQPHFLMNSLTMICNTCSDNPEALAMIGDLSTVLRASITALSAGECIPIEDEFKTVKSYLRMQERRFGDMLKYEFRPEDADFVIPPFTVQTLVENSIRHGIRARESGVGFIRVSSRKTRGFHIVTIEDNGVGFHFTSPEQFGPEHIGLRNVISRLELMCSGKVEIESEIGKGTRITLRIPVTVRPAEAEKAEEQ